MKQWEITFHYSNGQIFRETMKSMNVSLALDTAKMLHHELLQSAPWLAIDRIEITARREQ